MKKSIVALLSVLCLIMEGTVAFADDTEIYGSSNTLIQPNVLIIFDNSGSMNTEVAVTVEPYNPATDYSSDGSYDKDKVYRRFFIWWTSYISNVSSVSCVSAYNGLTTNGTWTGRLRTSGTCGGRNRVFAVGNYLNYLQGPGDDTETRLKIAKQVVTDIIKNTNGVKFGAMIFNTSEGGRILKEVKDMDVGTNRADLINAINAINATTWTPLGETLYEAGLYFKGDPSYFNGGVNYTTPIDFSCQKNYIIVMTDGESTQDINSILSTAVGDRDGDGNDPGSYGSNGSDWMDDVAKMLYDDDLLPSSHVSGSGKQNIQTYTIGFAIDDPLLSDTAENGKGEYFTADTGQELTQAFLGVIGSILEDDTSFVAPVVPVSPENKTFSGDFVYVGLFRPSANAFWSGNLKKYGLVDGAIVDKDGNPATNADGSFVETSISYWGTLADGGKVEAGGVGQVLLDRTDPRNIYTYLPSAPVSDLDNATNAFTTANALITPEMLGLSVGDTAGKDKLIQFVHGYDSYSGNPTSKRDWVLGDILHAAPAIVHYSTTRTVLFIGANDGILHAFDDSTAEELWGYIPNSQLEFLSNLTGTLHPYFVDGSPKAYVFDADLSGTIGDDVNDKAILIFGERRGGESYHAIDVTNPDDPQFLWDISSADAAFSEMGQSWSNPNIVKVKDGAGEKVVFFIGGGYDADNEDAQPATSDVKGRAVYAIDVETGNKFWSHTFSNDSSMTHAIPSDITALDIDGNGYTDRLYVGDVGARVWRFNVGDPDTDEWGGYILFESNPGSDGTSGRKILYPPDVVQELDNNGEVIEVLYFGTGDRTHPLDTTTTVDRIYSIKDRGNPADSPITECGDDGKCLSDDDDLSALTGTDNDLIDVTKNVLQIDLTAADDITHILSALNDRFGWYIRLDQRPGEKVVSSAVVFNKVISISTFEPTDSGAPDDPCLADVGTGRVYAINYQTGEAILNYYEDNDSESTGNNERAEGGEGEVLRRLDRTQSVGAGIPSEAVIVIHGGDTSGGGGGGGGGCDAFALVGIGGGIGTLEVDCGGATQKIFWKELLY